MGCCVKPPVMHLHRFKAFLDSVTPEEWFESLAASRAASKAALRGAWQAACDAVAARKRKRAERPVMETVEFTLIEDTGHVTLLSESNQPLNSEELD